MAAKFKQGSRNFVIRNKSKNKGSVFGNLKDLKAKIIFTFSILCIYRFLTHIPIPGVDLSALQALYSKYSSKMLDSIDSFSGGSLQKASIMALGLAPYISSSIIMQLLGSTSEYLKSLKKDSDGNLKIKQYTRYLTVVICSIQSYGLSWGLEYFNDSVNSLVILPGIFFKLSTVASFLGGTILVMWLAEQISSKGLGNGSSWIIFVNISISGFAYFLRLLSRLSDGSLSYIHFLVFVAMICLIVFAIIFFEKTARFIKIIIPSQRGLMSNIESRNRIPIKLNVSGVLPPMFAEIFVGFLAALGNISWKSLGVPEILISFISSEFFYIVLKMFAIVLFAFVYSTVAMNPKTMSQDLASSGRFVPGHKTGDQTEKFFERVIFRVTAYGALYLIFIAFVPDIFIKKLNPCLSISGTSFLILAGVSMEFAEQVQVHGMSYFMSKIASIKK
ncbi:preprotein translocase subunit SecY [Candidatus Nesciobacter abundans]|uniref:Protein translocase subunit SecY n=1 Tax=Candidatus Nesciobacter abundans TaxID=2601668 RepID=A0A5C0UGR4_9PROT|nr:preprotein translocase subunit SecY [Candidatus Nesciobacter abundans]QEK38920.1 preprotein translocase subunit SecY [Candidatus Nesciobacter abundans]